MIIKTKIQEVVTVWQEQEICVEVKDIAEFNLLKEQGKLGNSAIDWGNSEVFWDTVHTLEEDDTESEIIEILER